MRELLLVRHCASTGQSPDAPLSYEGMRQARVLAGYLDGFAIDHVVSSPYRRALDTIAPFASGHDLAVSQDARLRERELSAEPLPDWLEVIERSFTDLDFRHPSGESARGAQTRAWAAISEVLGGDHLLPVLVSHGNLLALVLNRVRADLGFDFWRALANPDVFRIGVDHSGDWRMERVWDESLLDEGDLR